MLVSQLLKSKCCSVQYLYICHLQNNCITLSSVLVSLVLGTKSATEYANGGYDIVSPAPSVYLGTFQILHLLEDLKMALEMLEDPQEKEALRNQIPGATALCIREWFEENLVSSYLQLFPFVCKQHWFKYFDTSIIFITTEICILRELQGMVSNHRKLRILPLYVLITKAMQIQE